MSDIAIPFARPSKVSRRDEKADKQALAQVEKWMAMIREFSDEPQGRPKVSA